ncbi:hypothetical protein ACE198_10440 [Neobacillus sp. KR4-4]|uniref:hypothetical protein n=1 Tax=Neobacillus sp. KR4-4 TaxID=3344872 RepID=UPI0035CC9A19
MWPEKMDIEEVKDKWGNPRKLFKVNKKKPFKVDGTLSIEIVQKAFNFAYDMSFGKKGKHRTTRTGGDAERTNGEIFTNTFQGKLSEYGTRDLHEHFPEETVSSRLHFYLYTWKNILK